MSHNKGLNQEQVAGLQSLKQGDRIVLYTEEVNDPQSDIAITLRIIRDGKMV